MIFPPVSQAIYLYRIRSPEALESEAVMTPSSAWAQVDAGAEGTQGLPRGSAVKSASANAGEAREAVSIPKSNSSIIAWETHDRGVWRAMSTGL